MAIGATLLTSAYDNADATSYVTASISPAANSLLLLFVSDSIAAGVAPEGVPTGLSLTWENIGSRTWVTTGERRCGAWIAQCGGSPGSGAITLTETDSGSGTTSTGTGWAVIEITGHHLAQPVRQAAFPPDISGTSHTITLSDPVDANSRPFAYFHNRAGVATTERTNWAELSDVSGGSSPLAAFATQWRSDTFETTASATFSAASAFGIAIEIAESGAADAPQARVITRAGTTGIADSTVTATMPNGATAGDLLIATVSTNDAATAAAGGGEGWTEISAASNAAAVRLTILAKIAAGGDALNLTLGSAVDSTTHVMRVVDHGVTDVATDIEIGTAATGTSATPDPPSVTPAADTANLFITVAASDDDDDSVTFAPTSYTAEAQAQSDSSTTSCLIQVAYRYVTTGAAQNPGTFTLAASEEWVTQSLCIPPAVVAAVTFRQHMGLVQVMSVAS